MPSPNTTAIASNDRNFPVVRIAVVRDLSLVAIVLVVVLLITGGAG